MDLKKENEITDVAFDFEGAHLALCHKVQGFSANNKPMPLLVKSEDFDLDEEAMSAISQAVEKVMGDQGEVQVTTSMFDFLRKWYNLYWDDADTLARILGYSGDGLESEFIDEQIGSVKLLKCEEYPELSKASKQDLVSLVYFIKSTEERFSRFEKDSSSEGDPDVKTDLSKGQKPSEDKQKDNLGELMATDQEKLEKAEANLAELTSRLETMEKSAKEREQELEKAAKDREAELNSRIELFEKAEQSRIEKAAIKKVATYSFVTEDERESFAKTIVELDNEVVVNMLDKAQAAIDAIDKPQGSDSAQGVEIAKTSSLKAKLTEQFGDGK